MGVLYDRYGNALPRSDTFRKADAPITGNKFGQWAGRDNHYNLMLPGGASLQFDLSKLTLADYRVMRENYQINASLAVLSFMLHQIDWHIKCDDKKIADFIEENLRTMWSRLIRAMSVSFWAGYSPTVVQFENNVQTGRIEISAFKDLVPEECRVNWKKVLGYAQPGNVPPTLWEYDGIRQQGAFSPIPVENTLWYPLLMESGDYYGRKLLKPAFPSWFFSQLMHLFSNRYFERFGEPLPIGRADFDDQVQGPDGTMINGRTAMESIVNQIRNRSVVVLPSDRDPDTKDYLYDIQYLESQMRGADFERYLSRLDEEMSLGLFTPILLFRTGDAGAYNLGVSHLHTFLWMLNALAGDMKEYIDEHIVDRLKKMNFGPNAAKAEWVPRDFGKGTDQTLRAVIQQMIAQGVVKVDVLELGQAIGLTLEEVKQVTAPPAAPPDPNADPNAPAPTPPAPGSDKRVRNKPSGAQQTQQGQ